MRHFWPAGLRPLLPHLGLLLLARSILVFSLADVFFAGEELAHGAATKAILDGLPVALPRLSYQYYEGGGLIASLLTAPVFVLLGPSHLANKLVALGFDAANLVVGLALARSVFGARAAWPFTLLYVFGPAACQQIALLNVGNHHAAIAFFFAVAWLALPILRRERGIEPGAARCLALGAVAGFGTAFNFLVLPFVLYAFAALLLLPPRLGARSWGSIAAGFALGALPLIWTVWLVGSDVLDVHGIDLRDSFGAPPTLGSGDLGAILGAIGTRAELQLLALIALPPVGLVLAWRARPPADPGSCWAAAFLLAFLWIFTAASVLSRFHPTYFVNWTAAFRYLPHWGLAVLLSAGALVELRRHPSRIARWSGNALLAALALLGAWATFELSRGGRARSITHVVEILMRGEGFDYNEYLPKLVAHLEGDRQAKLDVLLCFDDDPRALYPEIAWALYPRFEGQRADVFLQGLQEAGGERGRLFLLGLGRALLAESGWDLAAAVRAVERRPEAMRPALLEALGRHGEGGHLLPETCQREIEILRRIGAPERVYVGVGHRLQRAFRLDPEGARECIASQDPAIHGPLGEGLALALELACIRQSPAAQRPVVRP